MFKRFLYIVLFLFTSVAAFGQQYPVQGTLAIASPYPANLSDYANVNIQNLTLNLTLTDLSMANKRVRLKLFIQTQNATIAQSIDNIIGEPLIMLDGCIPQRFTNIELAHYFRLENLLGINPDGYALSLPEGIYTFGFEVYDYFTGNKLSGRISQTFWLIINNPPLLNTPADKSKIADFLSPSGGTGGLIFNWTPRSAQVSNTEYEFTLCELWDATGDPFQQFMSAIPKYQTTVSNTTTLIYTLAQPPLVSGYTYAWRVRAKAKAGFEDIGLYLNDGYSNLFTFRYGDPCPAPQSLALSAKNSDAIVATWDTPVGSATLGTTYKIAYRKYSIAGQWSWTEAETSDLFLTISNLEPATEYEIKVGLLCNDGNTPASISSGTGTGGEVVFTPSQRVTTLAAGQIAGIECGKEPTIDLSKQTLLTLLKAGDVVMANDFPTTITRVTGTSQGWSGEGWTKVPWLCDTRIHVTYASIKVNSDYQLIYGSFDTVFNPSGKNIGDMDEAAAVLDNFVSDLISTINNFITTADNKQPTQLQIDSIRSYTTLLLDKLSANVNSTDTATQLLLDSARNEYKSLFDCYSEENEGTIATPSQEKGGPRPEMPSQQNCAQYGNSAANKIAQYQNQIKTKNNLSIKYAPGVDTSVMNSDIEAIFLSILKNAKVNREMLITSTKRSLEKQASTMITKIKNKGEKLTKLLYHSQKGIEIIDYYLKIQSQYSENLAISMLVSKMKEVGFVSAHCDWQNRGAVDFGKRSNQFDGQYKNEVELIISQAKQTPKINPSQVFSPFRGGEDALHIEIKLKEL